jgi:hypothetical protein
MATSSKLLALEDQYVAAKLAFKKSPTAANDKKFEKLRQQVIDLRSQERVGGFTIQTTNNPEEG